MRQAIVVVLFLLVIAPPVIGEEIDNRLYGFRATIPEGFRLRGPNESNPKTLYEFVDRRTTALHPGNAIMFRRMGGRINPNDRLSPLEMRELLGDKASLLELDWNGRAKDVIRQIIANESREIVVYSIQFALSIESVQLLVGGPIKRDTEIRKLFDEVVSTFVDTQPGPRRDGLATTTKPDDRERAVRPASKVDAPITTRKLNDRERAFELGRGIGKLIGFTLFAALILWIVDRFRKGKKRTD